MSYFNNGQLNLSSQEKTYYKKSKVIYTNQSYKQKKYWLGGTRSSKPIPIYVFIRLNQEED